MPGSIYQQIVGGQMSGGMQFQNPMQKMAYVMEAMKNPAAFVRQRFPDIPAEIQNDPNQILSYIQRTRGITDQDIQKIRSSIGV